MITTVIESNSLPKKGYGSPTKSFPLGKSLSWYLKPLIYKYFIVSVVKEASNYTCVMVPSSFKAANTRFTGAMSF